MRHTLVTHIAGNNGHLCHANRPYFSVRHFETLTVSVSKWTVYLRVQRYDVYQSFHDNSISKETQALFFM